MADYLNRIDLLLDIAEMPAEATKRDFLRKIYDFPATAGFTPVFCERGEQSEEVKMRDKKLEDKKNIFSYRKVVTPDALQALIRFDEL